MIVYRSDYSSDQIMDYSAGYKSDCIPDTIEQTIVYIDYSSDY